MARIVVPKAAIAAKVQPSAHSAATTSLLVQKAVASVWDLSLVAPALHVPRVNTTL